MNHLVLDLETAAIDNAADFLPVGDLCAPSNYKDPEKIAAYIDAERVKLIQSAALDLDLARIVTIGVALNDGPVKVYECRDEAEEASALSFLVESLGYEGHYDARPSIVTFNGHRYDLPLLMRRARYLGIPFPSLNLDRYKSPHVDLYELLTLRGALKSAHALRWYFRRLNYADLLAADPLGDGGADVGKAIAEGRWDDVVAHCRCDIEGTRRLARWLGVMPQPAMGAVA